MSVNFQKESGLFVLNTPATSYQMRIGAGGYLQHLYYGRRFEAGDAYVEDYSMQTCWSPFPGDMTDVSPNIMPQEFSAGGSADLRTPCLSAKFLNGASSLDLRYETHRILSEKPPFNDLPDIKLTSGEFECLEVTLKDKYSELRVVLLYTVCKNLDIIIRSARVINYEKNPVSLQSAMTLCLDFPESNYDLIRFQGRPTMERIFSRTPLTQGKTISESIGGISSHSENPFVILCSQNADEHCGECYSAALVYSGNFSAIAEVDPWKQTRLLMGINPNRFSYLLESGEELQLPEVALCYSSHGFHTMSSNYHKLFRNGLINKKHQSKRNPILINSWEAFIFDFDSDRLVNLAHEAAKLGIEMLVIDDGWFGERNNDDCSLGDWVANEKKLKGTLADLSERVKSEGMKLGLWIEPEMISVKSSLYAQHPDWCLSCPGRLPSVCRNQLVLDLSRHDVVDYLFKTITDLLSSAKISYLKWDMNRPLSDVYSHNLTAERQGELYHRYILGVYSLLKRITERFPDLIIEGCASGGGRFDAGMLAFESQIWCSDTSDPIERLLIQYGTSFAYPMSSVSAHVSPCPNHAIGRTTPLRTRGIVAMTGAFGYELDVGSLNNEEKKDISKQVAFYKEHYELFANGEYYRLTDPDKGNIVAWQYVSEDRSEAFIGIVRRFAQNNQIPFIVKADGLDPSFMYIIKINGKKFEKELSGAALMYVGLHFDYKKCDYEAFTVEITRAKGGYYE